MPRGMGRAAEEKLSGQRLTGRKQRTNSRQKEMLKE